MTFGEKIFGAIVVFLSLTSTTALAGGKTIDACGAVLDEPGNYRLTSDLDDCPGTAISVVASDVSLNFAGHRVSCDRIDGRPDTAVEILASSDVTVRNGEVADCDVGIFLGQSHHSKITNMLVTGIILDPLFGGGFGIATLQSTHIDIIGNTVIENRGIGIILILSSQNRVVGNVSNDNVRPDLSGLTFGQGIAVAFSNHNYVIDNETSRNTDGGIVLARGSTGNVTRGNLVLDNDNYGLGMFSREDDGSPLATGNLNQSNVALGNGSADLFEAKFNPIGNPMIDVQPTCVNTWKDNTFETFIAPASCFE